MTDTVSAADFEELRKFERFLKLFSKHMAQTLEELDEFLDLIGSVPLSTRDYYVWHLFKVDSDGRYHKKVLQSKLPHNAFLLGYGPIDKKTGNKLEMWTTSRIHMQENRHAVLHLYRTGVTDTYWVPAGVPR